MLPSVSRSTAGWPAAINELGQVSGRSDTSYATRVALDVSYATHPSLLADLRILLRTPAAVLLRRGAY